MKTLFFYIAVCCSCSLFLNAQQNSAFRNSPLLLDAKTDSMAQRYYEIMKSSAKKTLSEKKAASSPGNGDGRVIAGLEKETGKLRDWREASAPVKETKKDVSEFRIAVENLELPDWASKYNTIGMVYIEQKDYEKAFNAFTEYEKRFPGEGIAYRNWAAYYAVQGRKEMALLFLQRAVELGYNDLEWLQTNASMENLRKEQVFIEIIEKLEKSGKK